MSKQNKRLVNKTEIPQSYLEFKQRLLERVSQGTPKVRIHVPKLISAQRAKAIRQEVAKEYTEAIDNVMRVAFAEMSERRAKIQAAAAAWEDT